MTILDVGMACHHGGQRRQFHSGGPHFFLLGLSPLPWIMTHSSWCSLPGIPFLLLFHWDKVPDRDTWLSPPCPSMAAIDKGILYHCGSITEILNSTGYSLCTWKGQHSLSSCPISVDRNVTCAGGRSFISFFSSSLLTGPDEGLEERSLQQEKSWPAPYITCSILMGLHRRLHGSVLAQDTVIFSPNIWLLWFPMTGLD